MISNLDHAPYIKSSFTVCGVTVNIMTDVNPAAPSLTERVKEIAFYALFAVFPATIAYMCFRQGGRA